MYHIPSILNMSLLLTIPSMLALTSRCTKAQVQARPHTVASMECSTVSGHEVLWVTEDVDLLSRLVPTSRKWLTKASSAQQLHTPTNIRETMSSTSPIARLSHPTQIPASILAKNSKLMRVKQHIDSIQSGDTNKTSKSCKAKMKGLSKPKTSGSIFVGSGLGE